MRDDPNPPPDRDAPKTRPSMSSRPDTRRGAPIERLTTACTPMMDRSRGGVVQSDVGGRSGRPGQGAAHQSSRASRRPRSSAPYEPAASVPQAIALEEVPDDARRVDLAGHEPGPVWRSVGAGPRVPSVGDAIQLDGHAVTALRVG